MVLDSTKKSDLHAAFEAWKERLDRYIRFQRDYFEGNGSQN
jgi:hypothetical protein